MRIALFSHRNLADPWHSDLGLNPLIVVGKGRVLGEYYDSNDYP